MNDNDHTDIDDTELVRRAQGGERAALSVLVARYYPSVLRLCQRLLGDGHEAEDIAQEAALAACLGIQRLREAARFGPWLAAIAANMARQSLRRRQVLSLEAVADPPGMVTLWSAAPPDPVDVAALRELHDVIIAALWELSPLSREAIIGFYLEGYSYAELATLLGVPVGTLKGRLVFGRRQLRARLDDWRPGSEPAPPIRRELPVSQPELVPVVIDSVRMHTITQHRSVVLRDPETGQYLAIFIGPHEADAIATGLSGQQFPRPMTHDLSLRLLAPLGAQISRVVIRRITDQTFFADIEVVAGGSTYTIDARPSDAVALAVRARGPVLVARSVLEQAGKEDEPTDLAHLEPGTPPPPPTTALLIGVAEANRDAIVGALLSAMAGLIVVYAEPELEEVMSIAKGTGPRLIVVDLDADPAGNGALIHAIRQQAERLQIIALGGAASEALTARVNVHLTRPFQAAQLTHATRITVMDSYKQAL